MQLVGNQLLILLNEKATGKKTHSEVEAVMVVITSKDVTSKASSSLLRSCALAKEEMITGTPVLFITFHQQQCPSSHPCLLINILNAHNYKLFYSFSNIELKHF